jgi:hypothetical protein
MSNTERILFGLVLLIGGIAIGMYYEHQRFIKEVQGLKARHDAPGPGPTAPAPTPEAPAPQPEGATA